MKIVLVYDDLGCLEASGRLPEDLGAEYESERTIQALLQAIGACGHDATGLKLDEGFPGHIRRLAPDLVFNIAEGVRGPARESIVPAWLDHLGIPYTGSDGLALAVSLDKVLTKTLAKSCGIRTPAFRRVRHEEDLDVSGLEFPLFVKPNAEGSSMGIRHASVVHTMEELRTQAAWVLETYRQDCLVEEFAPGREFCAGIIGNEKAQFLPVVEVCSTKGFYPYEEKHQHNRLLICPADIPHDMTDEMNQMGLKIFRALGCRDFARVDFKLDVSGAPAFLEINPLPGLSPHYGIFARQAEAGGMSHEQLIGRIIDLALERELKRGEQAESMTQQVVK